MEKRRFGRTGHMSSVAIFGAFAFSNVSQSEADIGMEKLMEAGVNHIDVAASYGEAEDRLGPWMPRVREQFFLGTKTMERSEQAARDELRRSLERLQTGYVDLHQIHAITTFDELDAATRPGGALDGLVRSREEGLTRYIGITGHGLQAPEIFLEALNRFDFDSILFPINAILFSDENYRANAGKLLEECRRRDTGTMIIKSLAREPWGKQEKTHNTWYRPFTQTEHIQQGVNFVLSQDVTGLCTSGDIHLMPRILEACENYDRLSLEEQERQIAQNQVFENIF